MRECRNSCDPVVIQHPFNLVTFLAMLAFAALSIVLIGSTLEQERMIRERDRIIGDQQQSINRMLDSIKKR